MLQLLHRAEDKRGVFPRESLDLLQAEVLGGFVKLYKLWEFSFFSRAGGLCSSVPRRPV